MAVLRDSEGRVTRGRHAHRPMPVQWHVPWRMARVPHKEVAIRGARGGVGEPACNLEYTRSRAGTTRPLGCRAVTHLRQRQLRVNLHLARCGYAKAPAVRLPVGGACDRVLDSRPERDNCCMGEALDAPWRAHLGEGRLQTELPLVMPPPRERLAAARHGERMSCRRGDRAREGRGCVVCGRRQLHAPRRESRRILLGTLEPEGRAGRPPRVQLAARRH